ncbi:MAG TPA: adenylate kinase [Terriglobales bacterium]|nr:adenylate kinase [Terriglobales bacterium]
MGPIVLLGVPGAGKGTQAKRLASRCRIPHLSTGDMFREMAHSGSELGSHLWNDMRQGNLVPDELVCAVVGERLAKDDCRQGYILDGFPRTVPQADWLARFLAQPPSQGPVIVIYLTVGYNDLYRRLLGRRSCPKCGRIYNEFTQPPRQAGLCDLDQTPLVQRKDDEAAVIRERLSAYEQQTLPLVEFFRGRGRLLEISGAEPVDRVSERIYAAIEGDNLEAAAEDPPRGAEAGQS